MSKGMRIKLGFGIGYSGARMEVPIDAIRHAEHVGFDSVWTAESYGSDAITPLAYIAALTKRIKLGTAVAQLAARTPANLAMCAQTIDNMAGGDRVIVGLGLSGPQVVEGWYGQPWGKPQSRLRDYVAIIKKILKREAPVSHDGSEIALPYRGEGSSGLAKPLKSILHGNPDIPILLGTSTPGNIRLTGEIADGWLSMSWYPGAMKRFGPMLQEGLAKRSDGKTIEDFEINAVISVVTGDVRSALRRLKPDIALYVGGMGAKAKNFHRDKMVEAGFSQEADRIQELYLAGRREEATEIVPDEYVDQGALVGPAERIHSRWKAWADSGMTSVIIMHPSSEIVDLMAKIAR